MEKDYKKLISKYLKDTINSTSIFDCHTHLFPPEHKNYYLSGLENILNYHYLIAELLTIAGTSTKEFYSLEHSKRANLIWDELFQKRTPMSESCKGVITTLNHFNISIKNKNYYEIDKELKSKNYSDKDILNICNINSLVMTNNPFDDEEWSLFERNDWDRNIYLSSMRLDNLLNDSDSLIKKKFENNQSIISFLEKCYNQSKPVYAAISASTNEFKQLLKNNLWKEILTWLNNKKLPLSLMLGVKRAINKDFGLAGDGIGDIDLKDLSKLCNSHPNNKFFVTCLSLNDQHELTVLVRKHPNLKMFGFWWFMNQPSLIEQMLKMRIDMLGLSIIPQHSDARVTDQLIYKWSKFKKILHKVLLEYYVDLNENNYEIDLEVIKNDISNLLNNNAKNFLNIK
tara:strand:+ start:2555 stop:3751 length:1197 start_codon:yes stop_codon:yes gene_type:complete